MRFIAICEFLSHDSRERYELCGEKDHLYGLGSPLTMTRHCEFMIDLFAFFCFDPVSTGATLHTEQGLG